MVHHPIATAFVEASLVGPKDRLNNPMGDEGETSPTTRTDHHSFVGMIDHHFLILTPIFHHTVIGVHLLLSNTHITPVTMTENTIETMIGDLIDGSRSQDDHIVRPVLVVGVVVMTDDRPAVVRNADGMSANHNHIIMNQVLIDHLGGESKGIETNAGVRRISPNDSDVVFEKSTAKRYILGLMTIFPVRTSDARYSPHRCSI